MAELIKQLIDSLRDLLDIYERLTAIAKQRRHAMASLNIVAMDALLEREKAETERLANSRHEHGRISAEIGQQLNAQPCTVSAIAAACVEPEKTRLLGLAARIRECAGRWTNETATNQLVQSSISRTFEALLRIMAQAGRGAGIYRANGRPALPRGGCFEAMA